jgi:uncharacterized hydrophobic protein (TIGR00271 family)
MEEKQDPKTANPEEFKSIWNQFTDFLHGIFDLRDDTDKFGTIEDIKGNIAVKGHTAWILVFSIFVASIGLNVESTAVVIGAMLISPLMGPILGIGLSLGINDIDTFRRSLVNFAVMIVISLVTSFLFFSIPIFQTVTKEIQARTAPDLRDVFIAVFGGLALIVALSRRKEQTNTVAGVAIATALMPPLCTAGFGIATGKWDFFLGAMYLFVINTVFIALATFIIVRFLRFPFVKYANSTSRKRTARILSFLAILMLIPSSYLFFTLFQQKHFEKNALALINDLKEHQGISFFENENEIDAKNKKITLYILGNHVDDTTINKWKYNLAKYDLENAELAIRQNSMNTSAISDKIKALEQSLSQNNKFLLTKEETIKEKEAKIMALKQELLRINSNKIPFLEITQDLKNLFPKLQGVEFANEIHTNFDALDTVPKIKLIWQDSLATEIKTDYELRIKNWLKDKVANPKLEVISE